MCHTDASIPIQSKRSSINVISSSDESNDEIPLETTVQGCAGELEQLIDNESDLEDKETETVCFNLLDICLTQLKNGYRLF